MLPGDNIIASTESKAFFMYHRHEIYKHSGFQISVSIQFVVFLQEIIFQQSRCFMFLMPYKFNFIK